MSNHAWLNWAHLCNTLYHEELLPFSGLKISPTKDIPPLSDSARVLNVTLDFILLPPPPPALKEKMGMPQGEGTGNFSYS